MDVTKSAFLIPPPPGTLLLQGPWAGSITFKVNNLSGKASKVKSIPVAIVSIPTIAITNKSTTTARSNIE